jgi:hypothetical protein
MRNVKEAAPHGDSVSLFILGAAVAQAVTVDIGS